MSEAKIDYITPGSYIPARLMMDLGAHLGGDSGTYFSKGYRVVAVEAYPPLAEKLTHNLKITTPGSLQVVCAAITPTGEPTNMFVSSVGDHGECHSIFQDRCKQPLAEMISVPGTTVVHLFREYGVPHYLKIDIEGADVVAIRQLKEWARGGHTIQQIWDEGQIAPYYDITKSTGKVPPYISVELSHTHPEEALEMMALMGYMGYDRFALVGQWYHQTIDIDDISYDYTLAQVAAKWFSVSVAMLPGCWFDLHARHKDAP